MRIRRLPLLGIALAATPALAQSPSPAQMGITAATPNAVQVLDSSHAWATIGTVDPVTHLFSVAGLPAIVNSFNTRTGAVTLSSLDVTTALGFTPISATALVPYALLNSPAFTGTPSLPIGTTGITQTAGDSSTKLATTAFVGSAITAGAYTLPTASTTVLGGVKVDGSTINISGGVISGTPPAITANSTPTSGFAAQQMMFSDGAKIQALKPGTYANLGDPSNAVFMVPGSTGLTGSAEPGVQFSSFGTNVYGIAINTVPTWGWIGLTMPGQSGFTGSGAYGFSTSNNYTGQVPDIAFTDDDPVNGGGNSIAGFRDLTQPTWPSAVHIYNTRTNATNGEWATIDWAVNPNVLTIGAQANGTGTVRPVNIVGSALTFNGSAIGGGISLPQTVSGTVTSGGIPYFNSTTQMSSSAALAASALVVGGGAGVAPSTITTGAGVNAVLGVAPNTNGGIDTSSTSSIVVGAIETGGGSGVAGIGLADVATGSYLRSGGVTTIPAWQAFGTGAQTAVNTAINTTGGLVTQSGTLAASALLLGGGSAAAITSTTTGTGVVTALGVNTGSTGAMVLQTAPGVTQAGFVSNGTQPTITGSGGTCATTTKVGGATAGTVVLSGVCATTNTIAWTGMPTAPNGWACDAQDRTTRTAGPFSVSASTTTGFTITMGATSSVAADVLQWKCMGY